MVTSPDGTQHKPKYYVEFSGTLEECAADRRPFVKPRGEECAQMLESYLRAGMPLPVALVMEYNIFAENAE